MAEIDINKPPFGEVADAVINPRFYVSKDDYSGSPVLMLFSEAHGWITYVIPQREALKLLSGISTALASAPE